VADMEALIARVREFTAQRGKTAKTRRAPYSAKDLRKKFSLTLPGEKKPEVILSEDTFVELGHPSTASVSTVLVTFQKKLVDPGAVTLVGPDILDMKKGDVRPFAQVLMVAVDPDDVPDPFSLDNAQYLMHRLPGWMVRSVPGRMWIRVGKKQHKAGLSLWAVGSALCAALAEDFPGVRSVETLFVTSGKEDVLALDQVAVEAAILSGRHKKLSLGVDGDVECTELNCETCEEKPVCDNLRDVVVQRRKEKRKTGS